jgi:predicted enzyme related to lactoylglutathione lyase
MPGTFHAGAVLYAKNLARVQEFYRAVVGFEVEQTKRDHVVLASSVFQLVVLQVNDEIAATIELESPPRRRAEVPVKLIFQVASISSARALAAAHGGELLPPEREWNSQGDRVCDGMDPEGNVFQVRQSHH